LCAYPAAEDKNAESVGDDTRLKSRLEFMDISMTLHCKLFNEFGNTMFSWHILITIRVSKMTKVTSQALYKKIYRLRKRRRK